MYFLNVNGQTLLRARSGSSKASCDFLTEEKEDRVELEVSVPLSPSLTIIGSRRLLIGLKYTYPVLLRFYYVFKHSIKCWTDTAKYTAPNSPKDVISVHKSFAFDSGCFLVSHEIGKAYFFNRSF